MSGFQMGSVLPQSSGYTQAQLCASVFWRCQGWKLGPGTLLLSLTLSLVLFLKSFLLLFVCFSEHAFKVKKSGLEPCARDLVRM